MSAYARRVGWILLAYLCLYEAVRAWLYVAGDPQHYTVWFRAKYILHRPLVLTHAGASVVALALGPWQLRRGRWHRPLGKLYLLGVALGSLTGLEMATMAEGGWFSQLGFVGMAVLWGYTGLRAWLAVKERRFREHEAWMLRNFALTFGAVMLRVYIHAAVRLGYDFETAYPWTSWAGWLVNLVLVELWLRKREGGSR